MLTPHQKLGRMYPMRTLLTTMVLLGLAYTYYHYSQKKEPNHPIPECQKIENREGSENENSPGTAPRTSWSEQEPQETKNSERGENEKSTGTSLQPGSLAAPPVTADFAPQNPRCRWRCAPTSSPGGS